MATKRSDGRQLRMFSNKTLQKLLQHKTAYHSWKYLVHSYPCQNPTGICMLPWPPRLFVRQWQPELQIYIFQDQDLLIFPLLYQRCVYSKTLPLLNYIAFLTTPRAIHHELLPWRQQGGTSVWSWVVSYMNLRGLRAFSNFKTLQMYDIFPWRPFQLLSNMAAQ